MIKMINIVKKISSMCLLLVMPLFLVSCVTRPSEADGWIYEQDYEGYHRIHNYQKSDDLTKEYLSAYEGTWISTDIPDVFIIIENNNIEIGFHTNNDTFPVEDYELQSSQWALESKDYEPSEPIYSLIIEAPSYFSEQITNMEIYPVTLDIESIAGSDYAITFVVSDAEGENAYYNMKKSEGENIRAYDSLSRLEKYKKDNILVNPAEAYTASQINKLTDQFLVLHEGVWEDPTASEVLLVIDNGEIYFSYDDKDNIYRVSNFGFESFEYDYETYYGNVLLLDPPQEYWNLISGLTLIPSNIEPEIQAEPDYKFNLRVQGVNGSAIAYLMQRRDYLRDENTPTTFFNGENVEENFSNEHNDESYIQQESKEYYGGEALNINEISNKYSGEQLDGFGLQSQPTEIESDDSFTIEFYMKDYIDFNDFKYVISGQEVTPTYTGEYTNGYQAYSIEGQLEWINQFTDYQFRFGDDYHYFIILEIKSEDDTIIFEDYTDYIS